MPVKIKSYRGMPWYCYDYWVQEKRHRGKIAPVSSMTKQEAEEEAISSYYAKGVACQEEGSIRLWGGLEGIL